VDVANGGLDELDSTLTQRSREKALLTTGHQFRRALASYHETQGPGGKSEYPATLDDLLRDNRFPDTRRYLRQIFVDPMTGKADWGLLKTGDRIVGVYSLSEKKPIKQDNFDPEDAAFHAKSSYTEWVFTYPPDLLLRQGGAKEMGSN
jgi:hypothetical protein